MTENRETNHTRRTWRVRGRRDRFKEAPALPSTAQLVIELTPTWIAATVVNGRSRGTRVVEPLSAEAWEAAWKSELAPLDEPLKRCLSKLDGHPARAAVVYLGPETFNEVFSCPSSGREARAAAMLALGDQLSFVPSDGPHGAWVLGRDVQGLPVQTHLLIAAERAECAEAVSGWLTRAGLKPAVQAPLETSQIARLVERSLQLPTEGAHVALWIGSHRSSLAVTVGGRMALSRRVDLGLENLVSALIAADDLAGSGKQTSRMTADAARELLLKCGITSADDTVDRGRGLHGRDILPVLQPVLQRFVVAVKQSLRFGLDDKHREGVSLVLLGAGSCVPRLGEILSEQTGLTLTTFEQSGDDLTDLGVALSSTPAGLNLLPEAMSQGRRRAGVRRSLLTGAAAALALCGVDIGMTMKAIEATEAQRAMLAPQVEETERRIEARERLLAESRAVDGTLRGLDLAMGIEPRWGAWMLELAAVMPPTVRLMDVTLAGAMPSGSSSRRGADLSGNRVRLVGYLFAEPSEGGAPSLDVASFADRLQRSPMVRSVSLGETRRTTVDRREALQFTLTAELTPSLDHVGVLQASVEVSP